MSWNASLIVALLAIAVHVSQALPMVNNERVCMIFDIPVTVSSENALYGTSDIANNIDAVEYAVYADTWSTPPAPQRVVQNITVAGTYNISAQLCTSKTRSTTDKSHILQIATHGLLFDKRRESRTIDLNPLADISKILGCRGFALRVLICRIRCLRRLFNLDLRRKLQPQPSRLPHQVCLL